MNFYEIVSGDLANYLYHREKGIRIKKEVGYWLSLWGKVKLELGQSGLGWFDLTWIGLVYYLVPMGRINHGRSSYGWLWCGLVVNSNGSVPTIERLDVAIKLGRDSAAKGY